MSDMNRRSDSGFSIDKVIDFCKKNIKYVSAGVITAAIVIGLAVLAVNNESGEDNISPKPDTQEEGEQQGNQEPTDEVDASQEPKEEEEQEEESNPEILELLSTYYNSYAAGDVAKLSSLTKYLSEMEKDYISMMNEHVEAYSNVSCIVGEGRNEGDYIVSVVYDMKFAGVDEALPGMNIFYVQTKDDGALFINNRYSSFNRELEEQKTKKKILELIEKFENSDEVQKFQIEVQDRYDKIIDGNEKLEKKVNELADAISEWKESYTAPEEDTKEEESPEEEEPKQKPEEEPKEEEPQQEPEDNSQGNESEDNTGDNSGEGNSSGLNYVPDGTVMTANDGYNVRVSMNESAELVGTTAVGDTIKVIMSYAEGWTKVEWNGTTGYIRTDLLLSN